MHQAMKILHSLDSVQANFLTDSTCSRRFMEESKKICMQDFLMGSTHSALVNQDKVTDPESLSNTVKQTQEKSEWVTNNNMTK